MTEARCDCGAVLLEVAEDPAEINDCQCSWCQRLGALWAYYPTDQVRILSGRMRPPSTCARHGAWSSTAARFVGSRRTG